MLTLFCLPKPFRGRNAALQRAAMQSWARLDPRPEILVFGNDEGAAGAAAGICARHIPDVARNEYGTPLVDAVFAEAQRLAVNRLLCYVNADIVLMSDFLPAVRLVARARRRFLMGGQRWDLDMPEGWSPGAPGWEEALRALVRERGRPHGVAGIDYFAFPRGLYRRVPPFAVGRTAWDNWLLFDAWRRGAALVDATAAVTAVHLNHDFSHSRGEDWIWNGPEAVRNRELAGEGRFTLDDADWRLYNGRLRRSAVRRSLGQRLDRLALRHPWLRAPVGLLRRIRRIAR